MVVRGEVIYGAGSSGGPQPATSLPFKRNISRHNSDNTTRRALIVRLVHTGCFLVVFVPMIIVILKSYEPELNMTVLSDASINVGSIGAVQRYIQRMRSNKGILG